MIQKFTNFISRRKKLSTILGIVIVLVGYFIGQWYIQRQLPQDYEIAQAVRIDLRKTIEVSGEIQADESADLHFQAAGKLAWIGVKEGDEVEKWQAVASQDKRTLEKQLKQDLIAFEKEYRDYQQSVEDNPLVNHHFQRILEKAQFDLTSEVLDVEIKNLAIELATLVTPIEGIVTQVDTPVAGVNVTTSDSITIVNPNTLYFEAEIDESDIGFLQEGQIAIIVLDAYQDQELESQVQRVDFQASTSEGGGTVFKVELSLPEKENIKYRLGMSGDSEIVLSEKQDVLAVPFEAVIERQGMSFVEVLAELNQVERREIEIGLVTDDYLEVLSGLDESEQILLPQ